MTHKYRLILDLYYASTDGQKTKTSFTTSWDGRRHRESI